MSVKRLKKVLCVFWTIVDGKPYFIVFKDTQYKEWTFISGGVKSGEKFIDAAKRECFEESRGLIEFNNMHHTYVRGFSDKFVFDNYVHMVYYIRFHTRYGVDELRTRLKTMFHYKGKCGNVDMENDDVELVTMEELQAMNLWPFIRNLFINNGALQMYMWHRGGLQPIYNNLIKV